MKSTPRRDRLATESKGSRRTDSKFHFRRLSTQPETYSHNPENSPIVRNASLNRNLFRKTNTWIENHSTLSPSTKHDNSFRSSPSKYNFELTSNMSGKGYGKVAGYGWAHLKSREEGVQSFFSIGLGKVKSFIVVELGQAYHNGKQLAKDICHEYLTIMANMSLEAEETNLDQKFITEAIQKLRGMDSFTDLDFSLVSIIVTEEKVSVASFGQLGALLYTKKQELIIVNQCLKSTPEPIHTHNAIKTNRYRASYRLASKILSSSIDSSSKTAQPLTKIAFKTYSCDQVAWLALCSSKIAARHRNQEKYLKECINREIGLVSKLYGLGQAVMEACKKIINDIVAENCHASMTALVVVLQGYLSQPAGQSKLQNNIWNQLKTNMEKKKEEQQETNRPKLLKYMGNRRSFIKNAVQIHKKIP